MLALTLLLGLALLVAGGDVLVRGAVALAARFGVSPLLVGLTVVGFGTSMPELVTSLQAAASGAPGIALGNVVGSNVANILLILGLAAVISPFAVDGPAFRRDGVALAVATIATVGIAQLALIGRPVGGLLVVGLVAYLALAVVGERRGTEPAATPTPGTRSLPLALLLLGGGIALTVFGARLLVGAAITLATQLGVSDAVIGLTVVAVGTSLPELVTSVVAALRRQGAIAFGNVVGSNVFNLLGILGVTALAMPLVPDPEIASFDVWVMLAATVALVAAAVSGWRVTRGEGAVLLSAYVIYLGILVAGAV